jgi:hypothetical protein
MHGCVYKEKKLINLSSLMKLKVLGEFIKGRLTTVLLWKSFWERILIIFRKTLDTLLETGTLYFRVFLPEYK